MAKRADPGWSESAVGWIKPSREVWDVDEYPRPGIELRAIERHVRLTGRDVLEVGCGNGRLTFQYAHRARSVVAIDPNEEDVAWAAEEARNRGLDHVRFAVGTAQRPPPGPFDVALLTWSL